jgi:hypothetical protein
MEYARWLDALQRSLNRCREQYWLSDATANFGSGRPSADAPDQSGQVDLFSLS